MTRIERIVGGVLALALTVVGSMAIVAAARMQIVPQWMLWLAGGLVLLVVVIDGIIIMRKRAFPVVTRVICLMTTIITITISGVGLRYTAAFNTFLDGVTTPAVTETTGEALDVTTTPFIVYISGSDSREGIDNPDALSDVNIVVVVNPQTDKILLASIPRDTYVQLHGTTGLRDKLTHAGRYGIEMSKTTLEDFLNITIDYTVKVSFDTVVRVVDQLGGIEIYSDIAMRLNAENKAKPGGVCYYSVGTQVVDGVCALRFARERKSYGTGDLHRGANQQEILTSIIEKLTSSSEYLLRLPTILEIAADSFETSFTREEITNFLKWQLAEGTKWQIESIALDGEGTLLPTYTMGPDDPRYVMIANEESLASIKDKIREYLFTF